VPSCCTLEFFQQNILELVFGKAGRTHDFVQDLL
jgi:hypothetical protein